MASRQRAAGSAGGSFGLQRSALPGPAPNGRVLRAITPEECFDRLEPGGIGRIGFTTADGVMILPVNFAVSGKAIIFRTAPDTLLAVHANAYLSFEADYVDEARHEGWSVLVLGHGHAVTDEDDVKHLEGATHLQPWAPGARDVYVRIAPIHISGRTIQPK